MCMAVIAPEGVDGQSPEEIGTDGRAVAVVFGGMNSLYCSHDAWQLSACDGALPESFATSRSGEPAGRSNSNRKVEAAIMAAKKAKFRAEFQHAQEQAARQHAEKEAEQLREELRKAKNSAAQVAASHEEQLRELRVELVNAQRRAVQWQEEVRSTQHLLCLADLAKRLEMKLEQI